MKRTWKKIRYRLEWLGVELLVRMVPLLSRRACARLAEVAGALACQFDRRGRQVALANLEAVFGESYSLKRRKEIVRESYQTFARAMIDLFWAPRLTRENYSQYIRLENFDRVFAPLVSERGRFCMTVHFGSFEWLFLALAYYGVQGVGVTATFKNPLLTDLFKRLRDSGGHQMIEQDRSMVRMLKHAKRGGVVGMLVDLTMKTHQPSVVIDCFGLKSCVTFIHALIHLRAGALLVPLTNEPQRDGICRIIAHDPLEFPPGATEQQVAQGCWDFFEKIIRANPGRWMWAYKHWRYKPEHSERVYPFYSNPVSGFDARAENHSTGRGAGSGGESRKN